MPSTVTRSGSYEVMSQLAGAIHFGVQNDPNSVIFVALPPAAGFIRDNAQSQPSTCGFHLSQTGNSPYNSFIEMSYMPNNPTKCNPDFVGLGAVTGVAHHELAETLVNPVPLGQLDSWRGGGLELADLCAYCTCVPPQCLPSATPVGLSPAYSPTLMQVPALYSNDANHGVPDIASCVYARATNADAYTLSGDKALYHQAEYFDSSVATPNGIWTRWGAPAGVQLTGDVAAVSWGPFRTDVFAFDSTPALHHAYVDNANPNCPYPDGNGQPCWDDPTYGGSWGVAPGLWIFSGTPAAVSWANGRLDVYAMAYEFAAGHYFYAIFHRSLSRTTLSAWTQITALPVNPGVFGVGAASMGPNLIDLFYVDNISTIRHAYNTDTTGNAFTWDTAWTTGIFNTAPAATSPKPGRIDVILRDSSNQFVD